MANPLAPATRLWSRFVDETTALFARPGRRGRQARHMLLQSAEGFVLRRRRRRGSFSVVAEGTLADIATALDSARRRPTPVEVRLGERMLMTRVLRLPKAPAEHLDAIVGLQIEKLSPWNPQNALHAFAVEPAKGGGGEVVVRIAVMARAAWRELDARLQAAGLRPVSLTSVADGLGGRPELDLLASHVARHAALRRKVSAALTLLLLCGTAAIAASFALVQDATRDVAAAEGRLAALRAELDGRMNAARPDEAERLLVAEKQRSMPVVVLIEALSEVLPDDTYLTALDAGDGEVRLSGLSGNASGLIPILEESPHFTGVRFASSVFFDRDIGAERFEIAAALSEAGE